MKSIVLLAFLAFAVGSCSNNVDESSTGKDTTVTTNENMGGVDNTGGTIPGSDTLTGSGTSTGSGTGSGTGATDTSRTGKDSL